MVHIHPSFLPSPLLVLCLLMLAVTHRLKVLTDKGGNMEDAELFDLIRCGAVAVVIALH